MAGAVDPVAALEASVTLVLGGARSGKTRRALTLAATGADRIMIATAEAHDSEMADRIARHRAERGSIWRTIEAPYTLAAELAALADVAPPPDCDPHRPAVVVDCLTLWLTNHMLADGNLEAETEKLVTSLELARASHRIILVSNELGLGLVPETALGRAFRDAQGRLNQRIAEVADRVEFVAAGLPLQLKP